MRMQRTSLAIIVAIALSVGACARNDETPEQQPQAETAARVEFPDELIVRIRADHYIDTTERLPIGGQDQSVFGDELVQQWLLIDKETNGLAEVFVSTARAEEDRIDPEQKDREPIIHDLEVRNANFWPRTIVAEAGDVLLYQEKDLPVAVAVNVPSGARAQFGQQLIPGPVQEFKLLGREDRIDGITSSIYPWMTAWLYVMRDTQCRLTDIFGECRLPLAATEDGQIDIHIKHPYLGKLKVVKASRGVQVVEDGLIRVSPSAGGEIELTIEVEWKRR